VCRVNDSRCALKDPVVTDMGRIVSPYATAASFFDGVAHGCPGVLHEPQFGDMLGIKR